MRRDLFIGAHALIYELAIKELMLGKKVNHWIWCIFPQMNLGTSYRSQIFALTSTDAVEYIADPVLGPRLNECILELLDYDDLSDVFSEIDIVKIKSSMTLFSTAARLEGAYKVLAKHFNDELCQATIKLLEN